MHQCKGKTYFRNMDCIQSFYRFLAELERLCSTIRPAGAPRSGDKQFVCFLPSWVQQSMLQSDTWVVHSGLIKVDESSCKTMPIFNCQISADCYWPKNHLSNHLEYNSAKFEFYFFLSVWAEEFLKVAWGN